MTASGQDDWSLGAVNAITTSADDARQTAQNTPPTIVKLDTEIMEQDVRHGVSDRYSISSEYNLV